MSEDYCRPFGKQVVRNETQTIIYQSDDPAKAKRIADGFNAVVRATENPRRGGEPRR
jgi:hypothetical protein